MISIVVVAAIICLIISIVEVVRSKTWPSPMLWTVWSIAILMVFGRLTI